MCVKRTSRWTADTPDDFIAVWREDDIVGHALNNLVSLIANRYFGGDSVRAAEYIGWHIVQNAKNTIAEHLEWGEWEDFEELTQIDYNTEEVVVREDAEERAAQMLVKMGYSVE